jgi:hypothetical protein
LLILTVWPASLFFEEFKLRSLSFSCKFIPFITNFLSDLGPSMLLLSSLDRLASVKYSRKLQFRNKFKYQLLIVLVVTILLVILNIPFLIALDLVPFESKNVTYVFCAIHLVDFFPMSNYMLIKTNLFSLFLPFFVMILSTILIAHHLIKHKRKFNSSRAKFDKEVRYVRVVLSVDLFYFITNSPALLKGLVYVFTGINYINVWLTVALNLLLEVYLSADFFLYYWCNRLFRDHVKKIFQKNKKNKNQLCNKTKKQFIIGSATKHT